MPVGPGWHASPAWQLEPPPQSPQWLGLGTFGHEPGEPVHGIALFGQEHIPVVQIAPSGHWWPQLPQLSASPRSGTQLPPPQSAMPSGQPH